MKIAKVHIGARGAGTWPVCGNVTSRTTGITMALDAFQLEADAARCARCAARLPFLLRLREKNAAKG